MGLLIPETAGIRGNLVSQDDLALVAAELDLKVHQVDAQAVKIFLHHLVYLEGDVYKRQFSLSCPPPS